MKTGGLSYQFISKVQRKGDGTYNNFYPYFHLCILQFMVIGPDLLGILQHATGRENSGNPTVLPPFPLSLSSFDQNPPFVLFTRGE